MASSLRIILRNLVRRREPVSTLDQAVAEVEQYLIEAFGFPPEDIAAELADPTGAANVERRYRQLMVWVRLLRSSRWLYRRMGFRERLRVRKVLRQRLDALDDFYVERLVPALEKDGDSAQLLFLAEDLFYLLALTRAGLLSVVRRVDAPFCEVVRANPPLSCPYPPVESPTPRIALRGVVSRATAHPVAAPSVETNGKIQKAASRRMRGDARRMLDFCLEMFSLPREPETVDETPNRPWS